jgi:4a-hydroxytetrahydrobiopterin dehydratase
MATPLDDDARDRFRDEHPHWSMEGERITRIFTFDDFAEAMGFVSRVALAAEKVDHHPDIDIRWNEVTLTLSTHSAGALTEKDIALAATIDSWNG